MGLNELFEYLDKNNFHLCGCIDMEEKYCPDYKNGICECISDCHPYSCKKKSWCDELEMEIDKVHYAKYKENEKLKNKMLYEKYRIKERLNEVKK